MEVVSCHPVKRIALRDFQNGYGRRPQGPWKGVEDVEYATLEWVDWFNNRRLLEPFGNVPPAEFEMAYYRQLEEIDMVD